MTDQKTLEIIACETDAGNIGFFSFEVSEIIERKTVQITRQTIPGTNFELAHINYQMHELPVIAVNSFYRKAVKVVCDYLIIIKNKQELPQFAFAVAGKVEMKKINCSSVGLVPEFIIKKVAMPLFWGVAWRGVKPLLLCSFEKVDYVSDLVAVLMKKEGDSYE